jgi:acyl homoserine lactone synthase
MISCISAENVHEFGTAFHSQFRLRHSGFVERQQYDVSVYDGMEFDQYDTPASRYLVFHTDDGKALGVSRLTPTVLSCMLKDLWPHLVANKSLLQSGVVWEGTRYCVDKDVEPELRQRIIHEMACAYLEFGLRLGLQKVIGLMPTYIYRSVFERPGIEMEYLGPVEAIGRHKCRAVAIPVTAQQLANVRRKTGVSNSVLRFTRNEGEQENVRAARSGGTGELQDGGVQVRLRPGVADSASDGFPARRGGEHAH